MQPNNMVFATPLPERGEHRERIASLYRADESRVVKTLLEAVALDAAEAERITERARYLVLEVRKRRIGKGGLDAFLHQYALSSQEGVVLMCLAEALLRIPDADTADRLIRDKLGHAEWNNHLGKSDSLFVNASTWALMLTGRVVNLHDFKGQDLPSVFRRLVGRAGEPVIRQAVTQGMRIMGRQFVMGRSIEEALQRAGSDEHRGYRHSYDMLGEAACTATDAERYLQSYEHAIKAIGAASEGRDPIESPGISVKLSALHPRYEFAQRSRVAGELYSRLRGLALKARDAGIGLTVDAEEADRLDLSLEIIERVFADAALAGWDGFGLAVQAYQKRALPLIDWLAELSQRHHRRLMVRLVKGAYWDTEIKLAQERGLDGYPVFTRKLSTDLSYLACARRLLQHGSRFFPQFATHNAHTLAAVMEFAGNNRDFEFQRLHGMGEVLYDDVAGKTELGISCRVYAPVGSHEDLLAYLVRRLLENGANTSFVNRIVDEHTPVDELIADPVSAVRHLERIPHPQIALPADIYRPERSNSRGLDLSDPAALAPLAVEMASTATQQFDAGPLVGGRFMDGSAQTVTDPADRRRTIGRVVAATPAAVEDALARAEGAASAWDEEHVEIRAACLDRAADLFERESVTLMTLAVREAGKTLPDAVAEIREAVDFCRYYAARARADFSVPQSLPGPTGEENTLALHGRGVFVCISPWNFPLAIFTGQIAAALAAGNAVIAKPAEQTPLIATRATQLFHEAGVPPNALHLLPGDGTSVGASLIADPRIAGAAFTGSTETARIIHRTLAAKDGPIVPLIAETGGQNAMIVDSSALPEQVVEDVVASAFHSAGQRCSALRVLFVQTDIAPRLIEMLAGAMAELRVGDPALLRTDVGPVIDEAARDMLERHHERMLREGTLIKRVELSDECEAGTFFAPCAFEIDGIERLQREVFGPLLHVVRFHADALDNVVDAINATGYGLTLGIHSRIDETVARIHRRLRAGNTYVNRNQIGAVVGVQPFGGEGLSGTGPKAGGPRYLHRFATERSLSVNTTAQGGNTALMSLGESNNRSFPL